MKKIKTKSKKKFTTKKLPEITKMHERIVKEALTVKNPQGFVLLIDEGPDGCQVTTEGRAKFLLEMLCRGIYQVLNSTDRGERK